MLWQVFALIVMSILLVYLLEKGKSIGPAAEMVNWDLDENKIIDMNEVYISNFRRSTTF